MEGYTLILLYLYFAHCLLGLLTYVTYRNQIEANVDRLHSIQEKYDSIYRFMIGFFITFAWLPFALYALYSAWKVKDKR